MRIIAGEFGGRQIIAPPGKSTRPMTDKVRGALFSILGPIEEATVLDAYAGSGALGIEALSRGAIRVISIESGREAIASIKANIKSLDLGVRYQLEAQKVETWLAHQPGERFDLIFAMPPYALLDQDILQRLARLLQPEGTMVVEYPRQHLPFQLGDLELIQTRSYGDPQLAFYEAS